MNSNFFSLTNLKSVVLIGYLENYNLIAKELKSKFDVEVICITKEKNKLKLDEKLFKKMIFYSKRKTNTSLINALKNIVKPNDTLFLSLGNDIYFDKIFIKFCQNNLINYHSTKLPIDAGRSYYSWKILRNDRIINQLFHIVDDGIDTGPIIYSNEIIIPKHSCTPAEIELFDNTNFIIFLNKFISLILDKKKLLIHYQNLFHMRYNPPLNTAINGYINWQMSSINLVNFITAFDDPYMGASTFLDDKVNTKVQIKSVQLHGGELVNHPYNSGIVIRNNHKWLIVSTSDQYSLIVEKIMNKDGENILKRIKIGTRLHTPSKYLDAAVSKRIKFK